MSGGFLFQNEKSFHGLENFSKTLLKIGNLQVHPGLGVRRSDLHLPNSKYKQLQLYKTPVGPFGQFRLPVKLK